MVHTAGYRYDYGKDRGGKNYLTCHVSLSCYICHPLTLSQHFQSSLIPCSFDVTLYILKDHLLEVQIDILLLSLMIVFALVDIADLPLMESAFCVFFSGSFLVLLKNGLCLSLYLVWWLS